MNVLTQIYDSITDISKIVISFLPRKMFILSNLLRHKSLDPQTDEVMKNSTLTTNTPNIDVSKELDRPWYPQFSSSGNYSLEAMDGLSQKLGKTFETYLESIIMQPNLSIAVIVLTVFTIGIVYIVVSYNRYKKKRKEDNDDRNSSDALKETQKKLEEICKSLLNLSELFEMHDKRYEDLIQSATNMSGLSKAETLEEMAKVSNDFLNSLTLMANLEAYRVSEMLEKNIISGTAQMSTLRFRLEWIERKIDMIQDLMMEVFNNIEHSGFEAKEGGITEDDDLKCIDEIQLVSDGNEDALEKSIIPIKEDSNGMSDYDNALMRIANLHKEIVGDIFSPDSTGDKPHPEHQKSFSLEYMEPESDCNENAQEKSVPLITDVSNLMQGDEMPMMAPRNEIVDNTFTPDSTGDKLHSEHETILSSQYIEPASDANENDRGKDITPNAEDSIVTPDHDVSVMAMMEPLNEVVDDIFFPDSIGDKPRLEPKKSTLTIHVNFQKIKEQ